jgi:hypothetical protein
VVDFSGRSSGARKKVVRTITAVSWAAVSWAAFSWAAVSCAAVSRAAVSWTAVSWAEGRVRGGEGMWRKLKPILRLHFTLGQRSGPSSASHLRDVETVSWSLRLKQLNKLSAQKKQEQQPFCLSLASLDRPLTDFSKHVFSPSHGRIKIYGQG